MPDEYWERVNKRWTESINDAKAEAIDNSARLRRVLIPVPMLYVPVAVTGVRGAGKSVIESAIEGHVGSKYLGLRS